MKYTIHHLLLASLALLLAGGLSSCRKEDALRAPDFDTILSVTQTQESETDKWIAENLNKPFNITIIWRWDTKEVGLDKSYIPPKEQNVLPYAKILRYTFLKSYQEVKGNAFIKPLVPKQFLFLGEYGYNSDGTITLGQAEQGSKIVFYGVDHWAERDEQGGYPQIREAIHTLYHEFGHILHQTKKFTEEYEKISKADYTSQWYNEDLLTALEKGFTSTYSMLSQYEDFVETIAFYCTMTPEAWDAYISQLVNSTSEEPEKQAKAVAGREKIKQKLTMIRDYLKSSWDIDLDEIRDVTLVNVEQLYKDKTIFPDEAPKPDGYVSILSPYDHNLRSCGEEGNVGVVAKVQHPLDD